MYLKYSLMIMTVSVGFLFWFIWEELKRLREQLIIEKSQLELYRKEMIQLLNESEDAIRKEILNLIRDDNAHNEKRLQTMAEEITGKIEALEQSIKQTDKILTATRDDLTKIGENVDNAITSSDNPLSLVSQLNSLLNYSVKDGEQ